MKRVIFKNKSYKQLIEQFGDEVFRECNDYGYGSKRNLEKFTIYTIRNLFGDSSGKNVTELVIPNIITSIDKVPETINLKGYLVLSSAFELEEVEFKRNVKKPFENGLHTIIL